MIVPHWKIKPTLPELSDADRACAATVAAYAAQPENVIQGSDQEQVALLATKLHNPAHRIRVGEYAVAIVYSRPAEDPYGHPNEVGAVLRTVMVAHARGGKLPRDQAPAEATTKHLATSLFGFGGWDPDYGDRPDQKFHYIALEIDGLKVGVVAQVMSVSLIELEHRLARDMRDASNPYLEDFRWVATHVPEMFWRTARDKLVMDYSWSVTSDIMVESVLRQGPIVEMGAGTGYWSWLLRHRGMDVIAYDESPVDGVQRNPWHPTARRAWTQVVQGTAVAVKPHHDRAMLLVWPPRDEPFATHCLKLYQGDTVVHIGDLGGCTGTPGFFNLLKDEWVLRQEVTNPSWPWINDKLTIWKRREAYRSAA